MIVINFGDPYLADKFFERINTCINAHFNTPMMSPAVLSASHGEKKMTRQSPVGLNISSKLKVS
jgi:beta-N-acetylhexosaminidase